VIRITVYCNLLSLTDTDTLEHENEHGKGGRGLEGRVHPGFPVAGAVAPERHQDSHA
jgi:hypothetical protein